MLYWITQLFQSEYHALRVFQYLTFRSILSAMTAFIVVLVLGPTMINWLKKMQIGQSVRDDGPETHLSKAGTPTMGGVLILVAVTASCLLWGRLTQPNLWLALLVMLGFGLVGWVDDYKKLILKNSKGLSAKQKLFWQSVIALIAAIYLYTQAAFPIHTQLTVPFLKDYFLPLGIGFPVFAYLMIVGMSNAVNLTDGLDGLATMPTVMVAGALGVFAYVSGNAIYAEYLSVPFVPHTGELSIFCAAIVGAGLGFLWYITYPAQVFL